jgi:hypothetical protein
MQRFSWGRKKTPRSMPTAKSLGLDAANGHVRICEPMLFARSWPGGHDMRRSTRLPWTPIWVFVCVALVLTLAIGLSRDRMPTSEIRSLLSGNTSSGRTVQGSDFHIYHRPDGMMSGQAHSVDYDVGKWEITDDDKFCRQWTNWRHGARVCFDVYRNGEGQFRMMSAHPRYEATFTVRKGDPEELEGRIGSGVNAAAEKK